MRLFRFAALMVLAVFPAVDAWSEGQYYVCSYDFDSGPRGTISGPIAAAHEKGALVLSLGETWVDKTRKTTGTARVKSEMEMAGSHYPDYHDGHDRYASYTVLYVVQDRKDEVYFHYYLRGDHRREHLKHGYQPGEHSWDGYWPRYCDIYGDEDGGANPCLIEGISPGWLFDSRVSDWELVINSANPLDSHAARLVRTWDNRYAQHTVWSQKAAQFTAWPAFPMQCKFTTELPATQTAPGR